MSSGPTGQSPGYFVTYVKFLSSRLPRSVLIVEFIKLMLDGLPDTLYRYSSLCPAGRAGERARNYLILQRLVVSTRFTRPRSRTTTSEQPLHAYTGLVSSR